MRVKFLTQGAKAKLAYSKGDIVDLPAHIVKQAIEDNVCVETKEDVNLTYPEKSKVKVFVKTDEEALATLVAQNQALIERLDKLEAKEDEKEVKKDEKKVDKK